MNTECLTCKWFDHDGTSPYGVCRAHPHSGNGWPRVAKADWCGEHTPAPQPEPPPVTKRPYTKRNG